MMDPRWLRFWCGSWLVFLLVLAQRFWIFLSVGADIDVFVRNESGFLTFQYIPVELLDQKLSTALLHWQASPPLPSLILAGLIRLFSWPVEVAWALMTLNAVIDAVVAALLVELIYRTLGGIRWALLAGLIFGLSPDLLLLDVNVLGQTLYETLTMLLVLVSIFLVRRLLLTEGLAPAFLLGLVVAATALTRSSYSFFSLVILALLILLPMARKRKRLAVFAATALLLQGGWTLKNLVIFGEARWSTSTWAGGSLVAGLLNLGYGEQLKAAVLDHWAEYPAWFVTMVERRGVFGFFQEPDETELPPEIVRLDRELDAQLLGLNPSQNKVAAREIFELFEKVYLQTLRAHPEILARKLKWSYKLYWFPIRYHPSQYVALTPLAVEWQLDPRLPPWRVAALFVEGKLPEKLWLLQGDLPTDPRRQIFLPTTASLSIVAWQVQLWVLHLITPIVTLMILRRRKSPGWTTAHALHATCAVVFLGSAFLHNLVEHGENMRFRMNVEPIIFYLVVSSLLIGRDLLDARPAPT